MLYNTNNQPGTVVGGRNPHGKNGRRMIYNTNNVVNTNNQPGTVVGGRNPQRNRRKKILYFVFFVTVKEMFKVSNKSIGQTEAFVCRVLANGQLREVILCRGSHQSTGRR